jgi:hypothetical protein
MGAASATARVEWMRDPRTELVDVSDPAVGDPDPDAPGVILTERTDEEPVVHEEEALEEDAHRAYADWTAFEDAFIRLEQKRKRPAEEMATALQRTPGAVSLRLRKLGLG